MKKFLFILLAFLLLSCESNVEISESDSVPYTYTNIIEIKRDYKHGDISTIKHFEYNGHQYILFDVYSSHGGGVVHDPDCPCHTKDTLK